jgi:hypothetical protein
MKILIGDHLELIDPGGVSSGLVSKTVKAFSGNNY